MPLAMLGFQRLNSAFLQVWRRYINEVAKMELVDTTRVGGVDVTRQRKLIKHGDSILFEFKD